MPAAKAKVSKTDKIADAFGAVTAELRAELPEREVEIDLLTRSIVAKSHPLFVGEPGVAKSLLVRNFMSHIEDAALYEVLMAKDTPSDQVLGPVSLVGLEKDEFRRITSNKLPEAEVGFLDEIFKANSTVLNAMLSIINERIFHNNGHSMEVPLWSVIGASNELPGADRQDLNAFRDRFGVTKMVEHVRTTDGLKQIIEGQVNRARGVGNTEPTMIAKADIEAMQKASTEVIVPANVVKALADLRTRAESENLTISVRRLYEGVKLMQAGAALTKRPEVTTEDMKIFEHVLWSDPEDHGIAYNLTLDYAGAVAKKAARLRGEFDEQRAALTELQTEMPTDGSPATSELMGNVGRVSNMIKKLGDRVGSAIEEAQDEGHETAELDAIKSDISVARENVKQLLGIGD